MTGANLPPREPAPHEWNRWYVTERGVVFRLVDEAPKRVYGRDLHVASVEHLDGSRSVLMWGPGTVLRSSWVVRVLRRVLSYLRLSAPPPKELRP